VEEKREEKLLLIREGETTNQSGGQIIRQSEQTTDKHTTRQSSRQPVNQTTRQPARLKDKHTTRQST
jgi:hypothetical protein